MYINVGIPVTIVKENRKKQKKICLSGQDDNVGYIYKFIQ